MQQTLPLDNYYWNETITLVDILSTGHDAVIRYIVEVDIVHLSS